MKVLISSYSPYTTTSYGQMTRLVWENLYKTGKYQISQHAMMYDRVSNSLPWHCYPTIPEKENDVSDRYGAATFEKVVKEVRPEVVWALSDLYMTPYIDFYKKKYKFKIVRWTVSEAENVDTTYLSSVLNADKIVFMTKLAADAWSKITGEQYPVIGAPVDPGVFTPISLAERTQLRKEMSDGSIEENDFLLLYLGQNQERKNPWLPFKIMAHLLERETPGSRKAKLWIHSPQRENGYDFNRLTKYWGLKGKDRVYITPDLRSVSGVPYENFKEIYNIADVLISLSKAEGFCIPLVEAASCSIPAVVTDYAGSKEVGRAMGHIMVPPAEFDYNNMNVKKAIPDSRFAIEAVSSLLERGHPDKQSLRKRAIESPYNINNVISSWNNVLDEVNNMKIDNSIGEVI